MTDVSDVVRENAVAPADDDDPAEGRPQRVVSWLAGFAALVALLCAMALPFAPVSVNEPSVSWPVDPTRPESTLLSLSAYRPLNLDVRFSCEVARLAESGGGVVLSTMTPDSPIAGITGMIVTAIGGRVKVSGLNRILLNEPISLGACEYRIIGHSGGLPSFQGPTPDPADPSAPDLSALAGPENAELVISRDGTELFRTSAAQLPDVDVLATSLTNSPAGGLQVEMRLDDEFTSSPTPLKSVLTWTLVAALFGTAALLWGLDRPMTRVPGLWRPTWPRSVDIAVPAVLVFWMFVAPATDDDGYYAAMAHNSVISGRVGNYYQLYDQNFTPFTWFYQALGWWQQLAGSAPVQQRIPAVIFGIVTWFTLRRFASATPQDQRSTTRPVTAMAHAVLAVVFLAWWVPQDMGVRPETVVALTGAATLLAVLTASRSRRLALAWLAFAIAGLGFVAHPTGFTLFAPLLAGLPLLWSVVHIPGDRTGTALRGLAVTSGGMVAPLVAFADGGLRDFLRGQTIFLSIQGQEGWSTEIQRYTFLLSQIPMGNYAKRSAVLVCLLALAWFAVVAVAARSRRVVVPTPLWLAGYTTAASFAMLWLTPSKWTHHLGAIAGVGSVFLALFLVMGVPVTREILKDAKLPAGVLAAAAASFVVTVALAWHGPNQWPYAWLEGMRRPNFPPAVRNIDLDRPHIWAALAIIIALAIVTTRRSRGSRNYRLDALLAVPVVVVLSLFVTTAYTVGTFGAAALKGVPRESIWAQGLADPTGEQCGAAGVVRVLDPSSAKPLTPTVGAPAAAVPVDFLAGDGYYVGNQPQGPGASEVWGSLVVDGNENADRNTGAMSTAWYDLPTPRNDRIATAVLAAGTLSDGNSLTAVYGRRSGTTIVPVEEQALTDTARSPSWRTLVLKPPPGAEVVRLDAIDAEGGVQGWLAFSTPSVHQPIKLADYLPSTAPVALAWPLAFGYPCQRQPAMVRGITEAPEYAILWGDTSLSGFGDGAWQAFRGGAFAQVPRTQSVQQLAVLLGVDPDIQVYSFGTDFAPAAYTMTENRRTVLGASTSTGTGLTDENR